jgi:antitoxin ParD1/3/4
MIREDEEHKAEERLEALLLEGLATEESELTRQDFADIRKEALARVRTREKRRCFTRFFFPPCRRGAEH